MNISTLPAGQLSIRQCHLANPSMTAFRTTKSPAITIHLMILFD
jgi:hypothetical protein